MNNLTKWHIVRVLSLRTMSSRYNSGWFMLFFCVWIVVIASAVVLSRWRKGIRFYFVVKTFSYQENVRKYPLTWAYNMVSLAGDWESVQEANNYSWSNPAVEHNVQNPLRLPRMFGGCQRYWHIVAVSCSSTCTDNLWEERKQCVYLVVKVGVTGEAPHGHFGQWEDYVMVTLWQEHWGYYY